MKVRADLALLCVGTLCCGRAAWDLLRYEAFQRSPDAVLAARRLLPDSAPGQRPGLQVIGRVEIPRLNLSTLVVDGDNEQSLAFAAGHLSGTAALGEKGNSAIAGHRDSSFRKLGGVHVGDVIQVGTGHKRFDYVVTSTQIVLPDDVGVLAKTKTGVLTLITCYPFRYIGSAPKRFVVQAALQE